MSLEHEHRQPRLAFSLPVDPARMLRARHRIRDYLDGHGVCGGEIDAVVLAMEEAMTNAVRHSGTQQDLEISLHFARGDLVAQVKDHGRGFDVGTFDAALEPDLQSTCGRGLFLIARLMDDLQLRVDGGLEVRAVKRNVARRPMPTGAGLQAMGVGSQADHDPRQQRVLDEVPELYAALDWEFRYLFVNKLFCRVTAREPDELLGRSLWEVFPEVMGTDVEGRLSDAMNLGIPSHYEFYFDPLESWFEQRLYPTAFGLSQFSVQINERKRREAAQQGFQAKLRRRNEELATLVQELRHGEERLRAENEELRARNAALRGRSQADPAVDGN
jgi:anti-sigma regulatory factor (Ser/Thr protein kinase)